MIATHPRQHSKCWSCVRTLDPPGQPSEVGANIVAFSQVRNLQHRAAKSLFHGCPAGKSQVQKVTGDVPAAPGVTCTRLGKAARSSVSPAITSGGGKIVFLEAGTIKE